MAISTQPFFDPGLAQQQRMNQFETETQIADKQLERDRLIEDQNLFRPYLERRFGRQMDQRAGSVAGRGFHGSESGVMKESLGELGEEQTYTMGEFERRNTRGLEDIERAIANLTARSTIEGAENVRGGAGRASERAKPDYQLF